jgi:hypothetical protein
LAPSGDEAADESDWPRRGDQQVWVGFSFSFSFSLLLRSPLVVVADVFDVSDLRRECPCEAKDSERANAI